MANIDDLQKQMEAKLAAAIEALAGQGGSSDLALGRALIHRGIHLIAERRAGEFCAVATYLAEMVGHAHGLMHGADPSAGTHSDLTH